MSKKFETYYKNKLLKEIERKLDDLNVNYKTFGGDNGQINIYVKNDTISYYVGSGTIVHRNKTLNLKGVDVLLEYIKYVKEWLDE